MKKIKHKYKIGDALKFKHFDGGVRKGKVTKVYYYGDAAHLITDYQKPVYTITVVNNNKKLRANQYHYPNIGHDRILESY